MTSRQLKLAQNAQKPVTKSTPVSPVDDSDWKHPAELIYSTGKYWTDEKLFYYCIANALSVSSFSPTAPGICYVSDGNKTVVVSEKYRIPIVYVSRWQWMKLKALLTAEDEEKKRRWPEERYEVLHIARVWKILTDEGPPSDSLHSSYGKERRLEEIKRWRCHTLDRILTRFRMGCFSSESTRVAKFWEKYRETEYSKDVLEFDWKNWLSQARDGVVVDEIECRSGLEPEHLMQGLVKKDGAWFWDSASSTVLKGVHAWSLKPTARSLFVRQTKTHAGSTAGSSRKRGDQDSDSSSGSEGSSPPSSPPSKPTPVKPRVSPHASASAKNTAPVVRPVYGPPRPPGMASQASNNTSSKQSDHPATSNPPDQSSVKNAKSRHLPRRPGTVTPSPVRREDSNPNPPKLKSKPKSKVNSNIATTPNTPATSTSTPSSQTVTSPALTVPAKHMKKSRQISTPAVELQHRSPPSPAIVGGTAITAMSKSNIPTNTKTPNTVSNPSAVATQMNTPGSSRATPSRATNAKTNEKGKSNLDTNNANSSGKVLKTSSHITPHTPAHSDRLPSLPPPQTVSQPSAASSLPRPPQNSSMAKSTTSANDSSNGLSSTDVDQNPPKLPSPTSSRNPASSDPPSAVSSEVTAKAPIASSGMDNVRNSIEVQSATVRGVKRSGPPLEKPGPSKQTRDLSPDSRPSRLTPNTLTEMSGLSNLSSASPSPSLVMPPSALSISSMDTSDSNTKPTSLEISMANPTLDARPSLDVSNSDTRIDTPVDKFFDSTTNAIGNPSSASSSGKGLSQQEDHQLNTGTSTATGSPALYNSAMLSMPLEHLIRRGGDRIAGSHSDTLLSNSSSSFGSGQHASSGGGSDGAENNSEDNRSPSNSSLQSGPVRSSFPHPLAHLLGLP